MFLDVLPVRKMRKCLYGNHYFDSSSAAERVCPKCRRKHNKRLEKYAGVVTFESTPQMIKHLDRITELEENERVLSPEKIDAFLAGDNSIDDSLVYKQIKARKKKQTATKPKKVEAVFLLESIIKDHENVKTKKVKLCVW